MPRQPGRPRRSEPGVKKQFVLTSAHVRQLSQWASTRDYTLSEAVCRLISRSASTPVSPHLAALRKQSPEQRLWAAHHLYWSARELKAAAFRAKHPSWGTQRIQDAVRRIFVAAR